jgi:hypothetical protein
MDMFRDQDFGFKLQVAVTALVALAVIWAGIQTGDWTGLILVVPLALLIPVTARLPKHPPGRGPKTAAKDDKSGRRY